MEFSQEQIISAYKKMRTIREFEEHTNKEFLSGKIPGFLHLSSGQEAVAVGVCENLALTDYIVSTHRGHGHCIAKGCDVDKMMLEIKGRDGGLCRGKGGSMHIADFDKGMLGANAIVGGGGPLAIGAGLTAKTKGTGAVSVCFSGDGGSNQGTIFEAMNLAVVLKLPVIFVFENNEYSEGTGASYGVGCNDIAGRASGFGMHAEAVDGLDFFAVHTATKSAVERARSGGGPTTIEAKTVRFHGHFVGDRQEYRGEGELDFVREHKDCLKIFRKKVNESTPMENTELDRIDAEIREQILGYSKIADEAPFPDSKSLLTDVYISY